MSEEQDDKDESIISHLEALRTTLLSCVYSIAIILPFTFFLAPKALSYIIKIILNGQNITLNYFSPVEVFMLQIKTAFILALIICFPYIAKKLWDFILPALYENEKKFIKSIVIISSGLFIVGVLFCLYMILPLIIKFGMSFKTQNINPMLNISNVISLCLWLSTVFGLMFQVPLITYGLIKSDIISYNQIADKRPYVIVGLLILAGIMTPPDIISQLMLAVPTYMLFEGGLLFSKLKKIKQFK